MCLSNFVNNAEVGGKVWLFWDDSLDFEFISMTDQVLSGWFVFGNVKVLVSNVYASCFQRKRRELWEYLCDLDADGGPLFVGGDFNIVRSDEEKVGGFLRAPRAREDFNLCIQDCGLIEIPSGGNKFSWCNGRIEGQRIWARLDRVLVNSLFLNTFGDARME